MGRLLNDVRTHLIASGEQEKALLAKLLFLNADSNENGSLFGLV